MAIVVRIDHDGMGAIVDIDRNGDEPVPVESVLHALAEEGVTYGIDLSACDEIVTATNQQSPGCKISDTGACGIIPIKRGNGAEAMAVEYGRNNIGLPVNFGSIDLHADCDGTVDCE